MSVAAPVRLTPKSPRWFRELPGQLDEAVAKYPLTQTPAWEEVAELSPHTTLEGVEAYGNSTIIEGDTLVAPATVYVTLKFDEEPAGFSDRFPARVIFHTENGQIKIREISIDTHSFSE